MCYVKNINQFPTWKQLEKFQGQVVQQLHFGCFLSQNKYSHIEEILLNIVWEYIRLTPILA